MKTVGIRELKAKLSEYLHRVRDGESISVTDRGRTIARMSPDSGYPDLASYNGTSVVRDPGTNSPAPVTRAGPGTKPKKKSYATLLKETQKAWGYKTPKETLTKALEGHLRYRKQLDANPRHSGREAYPDPGFLNEIVREVPPEYEAASLTVPDEKNESYSSLLKKAQKWGKHASQKETVTAALKAYVHRQRMLRVIAAFGTVEYDPGYDYKAQRRRP